MAEIFDAISEPIAISLIGGRYLLFDINVVTYLRRKHHICGVLIGSIPQIPQQNVFLGLPVELLPEEAKLLVDKEVAYIVDDSAWHKQKYSTLEGVDRRRYLDSFRSEGIKAKRAADDESRLRQMHGLAKAAARNAKNDAVNSGKAAKELEGDSSEPFLFDSTPLPPATPPVSSSLTPLAVTLTTTYTPQQLPENPSQPPDPQVPSSYPLYVYLHSREYFLTPGLRFGCDYTVYPGDPLRFHSHFLAVGYGWNQEIPMLEVVGGGRLGTGVKKGFLIGGEVPDPSSKERSVRTFCVEWGGM
ncbi:hypothetical protein F5884DRAFT_793829 [Xylogone sp. PMI_703]|nr:hypothetical protein F5884DRAFT_793829 [Xylogone sp. PMI_703]